MTDRPGIIYLAVNRVNGKAYVGQTTKRIHERIRAHYINKPTGIFQHALLKYGFDGFDACILEKCDTKQELDEREKYWISRMGSVAPVGYNLALGGGGALGIKHPHLAEFNRRPEQRAAQAERNRGEGNPFHGKTHSEETKLRLRRPRPTAQGRKRPDVTARLKAMTGEKNHAYGKKYSAEERKRFGQPGERNARHGVKLTEEFKRLISERTKAAMARPEVRAKFMATRGAVPDGTRQKMSDARKRYWELRRAS